MPFIVYEADLLVRTDICETLIAQHPDVGVSVAERLTDVASHSALLPKVKVSVVSLASKDEIPVVQAVAQAIPQVRFIVIAGTVTVGDALPHNCTFIPRPFASHELLAAVNAALAAQPEDRIEMQR